MGKEVKGSAERWGEFRFSVIGILLSAPAEPGELKGALKALSERTYRHPITEKPVRFAVSTVERWYYRALKEKRSPVKCLQRKVRKDCAVSRRMGEKAVELLSAQYRAHPQWSCQLHADNLKVALTNLREPAPSYSTVSRYLKNKGFLRQRNQRALDRAGFRRALSHRENFETRSFESDYVGGLFHLDFHHCSRTITHPREGIVTPIALAVMDDCSRFVCHLQWYLAEKTEDLVHGVIQALLKVGLPRALMSDNGSAMTSAEFTEGLTRLGILPALTLPYSPNQNGKQERFFQVLEGRLIAMCDGFKSLTLEKLNELSCAWLEMEYLRSVHRELNVTPARKYLDTKHVLRPSPSLDELKAAFRRRIVRRQRRSDGTVSIEGKRFEIPAAFRTLKECHLDYATWDVGLVHLVDQRTGALLCQAFPLDKKANASSERRRVDAIPYQSTVAPETEPPLLKKLLEDFAATGLPPSYIPKNI